MSYQFSCKIPVVSCRHDTPNNPLSNHNSSRFHSLQAYESWVIDVSRWILYHTTMERLQNHPSDNRFAYFFQWCTMITGGFVRWQWFDRQIKELMVVKLHALYLSISRQEVLTSRMTVLKSTREYIKWLLYVWRIRSETADIVRMDVRLLDWHPPSCMHYISVFPDKKSWLQEWRCWNPQDSTWDAFCTFEEFGVRQQILCNVEVPFPCQNRCLLSFCEMWKVCRSQDIWRLKIRFELSLKPHQESPLSQLFFPARSICPHYKAT